MKKSGREELIENTTNLSINVGLINEKVKYILYSEESNEQKRKVIQEMQQILEKVQDNTCKIAETLRIDLKK